MGRQHKLIVTCDAPGCDLAFEGLATDHCPIHELTVKMEDAVYWRGCLCAPCESKLVAVLKNPFSSDHSTERS